MSLSGELRDRLRSQAIESEIEDFIAGNADLQVTLDLSNTHVYHVEGDAVYMASLGLEVRPDAEEMMFIVPITHSDESDILSDLENASRTEITAEIGDWDSLLAQTDDPRF